MNDAVGVGLRGASSLDEHIVSTLAEQVESNIRRRKLAGKGAKVLVAVSGGLDSMVLLHLLATMAPRLHWDLGVAHFDHRLRRDSADDAALVRSASRSLGCAFFSGREDVAKYAKQEKLSVEMAARALRHRFLARVARDHRWSAVALGHHADDQVELLFLRLLRGAGSEGLAGMKWSSHSPADPRVRIIRPLLDQPRQTLHAYAVQNKLRFNEDVTNASLDFQRNRIRNQLLPLLKRAYQPALTRCILRVADILGAEAAYLEGVADRWLRRLSLKHASELRSGKAVDHSAFEELPTALQRQVLRLQLLRLGHAPEFELIEQLRADPGRVWSIGQNLLASRDTSGRVLLESVSGSRFQQDSFAFDLAGNKGKAAFGGAVFRWCIKPAPPRRGLHPRQGKELFDADAVGRRIILRHWHEGDRFQPIGAKSEIKLQDFFTNEKVLRKDRHGLILGCAEGKGIFWVERLRISERFKLTATTKRTLYWTWERKE